MNLTMSLKDFNKDNIYLLDPIKNFVLDEAYFYKIIYSTNIVSLNNIIFDFKIYNVSLYKSTNKYKMTFEKNDKNMNTIKLLNNIESDILDKINLEGNPNMDINNILTTRQLKLYSKHELHEKIKEIDIKVKISGIWKTYDKYGITYKFSV